LKQSSPSLDENRALHDGALKYSSWRWAAALLYLALIHWASSLSPTEGGLSLPDGMDKMAHLCEFGILVILLWRPARHRWPAQPEMRIAATLFIFAAGNGIIDEFHQSFVFGRISSWADAGADMLGAGAAVFWCLHREKARTKLSP
jgi:VanZ family protein